MDEPSGYLYLYHQIQRMSMRVIVAFDRMESQEYVLKRHLCLGATFPVFGIDYMQYLLVDDIGNC